ncbi:uncharacterized protein LOC123274988 [Cotesia glomerata]|uniref:uncharacterized protein LOC123274988 n=1 Tax=Cotesia glomerata TaxID=32391 RepID=UPI001D006B98|nr:uncharacterized protein LOC123274988 [Cotesia glomerata]
MTRRLSYHAWITAFITFNVLLLTTSASYSGDLPEFVESRQLRRNLANSKFKNHLDWLKNHTLKPLEESEGTKPPPVWEKEIKIQINEPDKEHEAWEKEMKELTQKQLKKWQTIDEKSIEDTTAESKDESGVKSEVNLSEIDFSSRYKPTEGEGSRRTFSTKFDFEKFYNSSSKSGAPQATGLTRDERIELKKQSGRWGMSMKNPPAGFLAAVSRADDRDENKFKEIQARPGSGTTGVKKNKIPKINRWDEGDLQEPGNEAMEEGVEAEVEDNKLSEPGTNFSSDRWGMSVTSPPSTFLREILSNHIRPISANNSDSGSGLSSPEFTDSAVGKVLTHKTLDFDFDNFKKDVKTGNANRAITDNKLKKTRPLMPIFFIGPSFWSLELPGDLRQPLGIIPNELTPWEKNKVGDKENRDREKEKGTLTSSLENIHLMNTKIIIGEVGNAEVSKLENYENENRDNNEGDNDN